MSKYIEFSAEIERGEATRIIYVSAQMHEGDNVLVTWSPLIPLTGAEVAHIFDSARARMGVE